MALAVQNILGDLFASLAIAVDVAEVGDFIVVGSVSGTVQVIGLKTTRIRSLQGEQVVMSNTDLLKQTISNYRLLEERRIVFSFGVTYDTTPEQAEAIPAVVRKLVESHENLRFDRAPSRPLAQARSTMRWCTSSRTRPTASGMDMQQSSIWLDARTQALGVEFAFPTQTVYIASLSAAPAWRPRPRCVTLSAGSAKSGGLQAA